jgi:hypothetical protein
MKTKTLLLVISITTWLLPFGVSAQSVGRYEVKKSSLDQSISNRADTVEFDKLLLIAKKYGLEKNFTWQPPTNRKDMARPAKVIMRISIQEFEEWMNQVAFNERRAQILEQFYLVDLPRLRSGDEMVKLKRTYLKKYQAYLKDEPAFQEDVIKSQEANSGRIILNTEKYRQNKKE